MHHDDAAVTVTVTLRSGGDARQQRAEAGLRVERLEGGPNRDENREAFARFHGVFEALQRRRSVAAARMNLCKIKSWYVLRSGKFAQFLDDRVGTIHVARSRVTET